MQRAYDLGMELTRAPPVAQFGVEPVLYSPHEFGADVLRLVGDLGIHRAPTLVWVHLSRDDSDHSGLASGIGAYHPYDFGGLDFTLAGLEVEVAQRLLDVAPLQYRHPCLLPAGTPAQELDGLLADSDVLFGQEAVEVCVDCFASRTWGGEYAVGRPFAVDHVQKVAQHIEYR